MEHGKKVDEWRESLPAEWREGDMFFLPLKGIDPICDGWILAKQHTDDPKLWYALPVDSWDTMVGSMDTVVTGKHFGVHVCRTLCGTWIHTSDMSFENRWDAIEGDTGAPKSKLKHFVEGLLSHREGIDNDPDYEDWIDELHGYSHLVSERLHFGEEE